MTMTLQTKRKKKVLSPIFQEALDGLTLDIEKLQPRVDRVFTVGRQEGMNDKEIGKEVRKKMKGQYGHDTIWRVFENYPEAKNPNMKRIGPKTRPIHEEGICPKCGKPVRDPRGGDMGIPC